MPFWTNHNARTTSWDPPPSAAAVGVVSEVQGLRHGSLDTSAFESVEQSAAVAAAIGVRVNPSDNSGNLAADGTPLPEGNMIFFFFFFV